MLKIGICDNHKVIRAQIESVVIEYSKKSGREIIVNTFLDGSELVNFIENENNFDLIFLDIKMNNMGGLTTSQYIRGKLDDHITKIVFISSFSEYAMELFEVQPLYFIVKPLVNQEINKCIKLAEKLLIKENGIFSFSSGKKIYNIKYKEIIYFESHNKTIEMVTSDNVYRFYSNFAELKSKLNEDFIMPHRSYLANMKCVISIDGQSITFFNGKVIPVSRSKLKALREYLLDTHIDTHINV